MRDSRLKRQVDVLKRICAESYQIVGILADEAGRFNDPSVVKALDNLSQQKLVHADVLPFPCACPSGPDPESVRQIIYALERSAALLEWQARRLGDALDYNAEFPAEDAKRLREAIELLSEHRVFVPRPDDWSVVRQRWEAARKAGAEDPACEATPEEQSALEQMLQAYKTLRALGWEGMRTCPIGVVVRFIEVGSTAGICPGRRNEGNSCMVFVDGEVWRSRPLLWKPMPKDAPGQAPGG